MDFNFSGASKKRVTLRGSSQQTASREDLVKKAREEREKHQLQKKQESSAIRIQVCSVDRSIFHFIFHKRGSDHTNMCMCQMFEIHFSVDKIHSRMIEMVEKDRSQAAGTKQARKSV